MKDLISKVNVMLQGKPNKNEEDVVGRHLDEFYELSVQHAPELAVAINEIDNLALKVV